MFNIKNEYYFEDFKEVKFLELREKLTKDELEEGLTPISEIFRVCITQHAYYRMYGEWDRYCEYDWVENLFIEKSTAIINCPNNEEAILISNDKKIAIVFQITRIQGELSIVIISVIRNVIMGDNGERELDNRSNTKGKIVI